MLKMQSSARRKAYITAMKLLMGVAAVLTCELVVGMIGYILGNGIPNITWEMLSTAPSYLANRVGILPDILSTLYIVIATLLIVLPLGVGAAIYLTEYATNRNVVAIIEFATETLTGIPSIIYGFFGMIIIRPFIAQLTGGLGFGALTAWFVLAIMIVPTITTLTIDALNSIPMGIREASYAMGATKWQTIYKVVLPAAKLGIVDAIVLGMGRAIGETMAVIMVAGNQPRMPKGLLQGVRTMTANIVTEMGYASGLHREALIATGVVLFVFILIINLSLSLLNRRAEHAN